MVRRIAMTSAFVSEIFPTLQGEGPFMGRWQIFLRLAGCPLRCDYCDTPGSLTSRGHPRMTVDEAVRAVLDLRSIPPLDSIALENRPEAGGRSAFRSHYEAEEKRLGKNGSIDTVSVTGGEPLAQAAFLEELLPRLRESGLKIYLETAGVHPEELARVLEWCDVVAMDIKLPSATGRPAWDEHRKFLRAAGPKSFVKIVLTAGSLFEEVKRAVLLIAESPARPILVFQPVTPLGAVRRPAPEIQDQMVAFAREHLPDVRVLEQQHKIWGAR
jgi:7-carboxy-7-deazaguanine synthase